ncbi:transcription factor JUNGBRUNNEN 1-like [Pyrus ussuriensis x Pyrus communis]|uniref:Transcription factor JUNGBRUNNEN 1-like n=1 Tax=Pyrus ussuriensis x Pyrus communis TaxID=2448454 RepID=A0A5N5FTM5_9ROSA|nr:transcription factor JUNGBRUNNEN 1-like [Pyrus ussuriensis x Pyrus communis]
MEVVNQKMMSTCDSNNMIHKDQDANMLPGFRFHPTDEELVRFYLRRKVENKPIRFDLIKHIDIYKYDPWDLPTSGSVGDKEWYFFCRRGQKYKNSIRPNRVTKSGFWKATGIDKPVYSVGDFHSCIGLKKSLVYYRGSAGKGTKTDWMMHEFRLSANSSNDTSGIKNSTQEAEVWTLCRIMKRNNTSSGKYTSNWHKTTLNPKQSVADSSSKTCSSESDTTFGALAAKDQSERSPLVHNDHIYEGNPFFRDQLSLKDEVIDPYSYISFPNSPNEYEMLTSNGNWDELRPMVDCVLNPSLLFSYS